MKTRFVYWWDLLREQLWFIPSLMALLASALACFTISVDNRIEVGTEALLPWLATTPASSRVVLGALIGALVTVLGLAFSLTMLAVSQTAAQYGPRLIRTVFDRNVTQYVMGMYLATIVYCMLVLRSIRDFRSDSGVDFTPNISVLFAQAAGALCLFALLAFANHVAKCMRAELLVERVFKDAMSAIDDLCKERSSFDSIEVSEVNRNSIHSTKGAESFTLKSESTGYLQAVEYEQLLRTAKENDLTVQVHVRPGDFVHSDSTLAGINGTNASTLSDSPNLASEFRNAFLFGLVRTPRQDVESAIWELVETGVRALSPGVNDPFTAINVIDYLAAIMRRLAKADWPGDLLEDAGGTPRVELRGFTFANMLDAGFDQLRQNAGSSVSVNCRLLEGLLAVIAVTNREDRQKAIIRQAEMVFEQAKTSVNQRSDMQDISRRFERILEAADFSENRALPTV